MFVPSDQTLGGIFHGTVNNYTLTLDQKEGADMIDAVHTIDTGIYLPGTTNINSQLNEYIPLCVSFTEAVFL